MSAKIQVIFYSMYGHVYQMAEAVAAGARDAGAKVSVLQVPELVPDEILEQSGAHAARAVFAHVPVATPAQLVERAGCGQAVRWSGRSGASSPARHRNTAVKR
jgi:NAD(P)H dehydrogenase (quinone)